MSLEADETSHQDLDARVKAMVERVLERAAFPLCWLAWAKRSEEPRFRWSYLNH